MFIATFMKKFFIGLVGLAIGMQMAVAQNAKRPNVVMIVSDDHGSRDLGCYGNTVIQTPNLDALAKEGVRFNNAYCTSASCSASRSVILSGMYNHANGQYGHGHHWHHFAAYEHIFSLPVLLEQLGGYRTARVGKYHVAPEKVYHFDQVFEASGRNTKEMALAVQSFVEEKSDQPFFLYFCPDDPHRDGNYQPGPLGANRFGNRTPNHYAGIKERIYTPQEVLVPEYLPDSKQSREELAEYYQSVARMDQGLGDLFSDLKKHKKWDNTIILYLSDNGIAFAGAKTTQYQPGINLPLIVKNAHGEHAGTSNESLVNWADLTPTVLDMVGVLPQAEEMLKAAYAKEKNNWDCTVNQAFHGQSFEPAMAQDSSFAPEYTFASHTFHEVTMYYPMRTVIGQQYKLIWNIAYGMPYPHAQDLWKSSTFQAALSSEDQMYGPRSIKDYTFRAPFELYDLKNDPMETKNLADDPAYEQQLKQLQKALKDFQQRTNDPWFQMWERQESVNHILDKNNLPK